MSRDDDKWIGTEFENVHPVLGAGLRAVPKELRPAPPYHLGGPRPRVSGHDLLVVGHDAAQRVRPWVRDDRRSDFKRALAATKQLLDLSADASDAARDAISRELSMLARLNLGQQTGRIAPMLCTAALNVITRFTDRALQSIASIVARTAVLHAEYLRDETADYLRTVDAMLSLGECRDAVRKYAPEQVEHLEAVLFRADRGNGTAGHFVFRLSSGALGLVTKIKGRYRFFEGGRDDIFATLPESLLEAAHSALAG